MGQIGMNVQSNTPSASANDSIYSIGKVLEILVPNRSKILGSSGASARFICVEKMGFLGKRHDVLDLPCVELTGKETIIRPEVCTTPLLRGVHPRTYSLYF